MNNILLLFLQAIQETGSISQAARQLYVTQPYVSRIIKEAEKQYDVPLLDRRHHPIVEFKSSVVCMIQELPSQ